MSSYRRNPQNAYFCTAVWAAKLGLLLAGVVALYGVAKLAVPYCASLLSVAVPKIWAVFRAWLAPPYLFITVHFIIFVIWKLSDQKPVATDPPPRDSHLAVQEEPVAKPKSPTPSTELSREISHEILWKEKISQEEISSLPSAESCVTTEETPDERSTATSRVEIIKSEQPAVEPESVSLEQEGEESTVVDSGEVEEDDSLDATWKAIMERTSRSPAPAARGREASGGADEMKRRFDDFIRKNRDQIRLQNEEPNRNRLALAGRAF